METKTIYKSVDEIIETQSSRVEELKQSVSLVKDQKFLHDHIRNVLDLLNNIKDNMRILRDEKDRTNKIIQRMQCCQMEAENLEKKLTIFENSIPNISINKPSKMVFTRALLESTLNENINNETPHSIRRQLDFMESFIESAHKLKISSQSIEMPYITPTEYESIPGYMRGRVTYDTINTFIDKINTCLEEKYNLLSLPRSSIKKRIDLDRYTIYKRQECTETKGKRFFTQDDLKNVLGGKIDKATLNLLTMLRHTRHIREVRVEGLLRYIKQ